MNQGEITLKKVQEYVETVNSKEYSLDNSAGRKAYESGLNNTLTELEEQLTQEKAKSERLRNSIDAPLWNEASSDPSERLRQLQVITSAYRSLAESEPLLPASGSHVPGLLTYREVHRLVLETQESILAARALLAAVRQDLFKEQADLSDGQLLTKTLESRIEKLRVAASQKARQDPAEIAEFLLTKERDQASAYKQDYESLTDALSGFVDSNLAPLIAAEELGGPVAGSTQDISEDVLAAGFDVKGKRNKAKKKLEEGARQQRIDKMFAGVRLEEDTEPPEDETQQAAAALKDFLGELLQVSIDHGGRRDVAMEKETAISRFLVRTKAAVLDPRDARKIRLVDFARTLED